MITSPIPYYARCIKLRYSILMNMRLLQVYSARVYAAPRLFVHEFDNYNRLVYKN